MGRIHTSGDIPYSHRLIKTTGSKEVGFVIEADAKYEVCVSFQNLDGRAL